MITNQSDFSYIGKTKKFSYCDSFVLKTCNKNELKDPKNNKNILGFVISRKIGKSVTRNKIKRRLRHILNDFFEDIEKTDKAFVFFTKKPIAQKSFPELKKELDKILKLHIK
jgi:ribonuclease P protein component